MYWLISLLTFETILEGLLCNGLAAGIPLLRKIISVAISVTLIGVTIALCSTAWYIWLWSIPIVAYRLINILRNYRSRLPRPQLRVVSVRAFGWLVIGQVSIITIAWLTSSYEFEMNLLAVIASAQLLCAVILLRASMHTWRHASVMTDVTALVDTKLPSLSVLVPARNETDDLQECLSALVASDYPKLEIIVLDDCSVTRRTPDIIRSFAHQGVRFINGAIPDESRWLAKNFAYERLSQEASGELLLFCGVDTRVEPQSFRRLVEILEGRQKDMVSVMPLRAAGVSRGNSLLQAVRYYWEICLPRGFFKRPPVLSTCWLIRAAALQRMGGFESVSRSVSPEAPFARRAVITDAYSFIRSDETIGIYSNKEAVEQYSTSVRVRYPQLHRRLELVALVSLFELTFLLGPLIGLLVAADLVHAMAYVAVWGVALLCLLTTYAIVTVGARLANPWYGWMLMPVAFVMDLVVLHVSLWKYEFSSVEWKGRNVCIPVMQLAPTVRYTHRKQRR
jgi:hypothetical protein